PSQRGRGRPEILSAAAGTSTPPSSTRSSTGAGARSAKSKRKRTASFTGAEASPAGSRNQPWRLRPGRLALLFSGRGRRREAASAGNPGAGAGRGPPAAVRVRARLLLGRRRALRRARSALDAAAGQRRLQCHADRLRRRYRRGRPARRPAAAATALLDRPG